MTEFEFLFSVFGLLIGLTFIEIAIKFADAIDAHARRPIGVLTPLLALFVMIDVAGYWLFSWSIRDLLHVRWRTVFVALTVAMIYYLSASMIFPRSEGEWKNLDEHYWARKRFVIGGVLLVEGATMAWQLSRLSRPSTIIGTGFTSYPISSRWWRCCSRARGGSTSPFSRF